MINHHMYKVIDTDMRHLYICSVVTLFWFKRPLSLHGTLAKEMTHKEIEMINRSEYIQIDKYSLVEKTEYTKKYYRGKVATK